MSKVTAELSNDTYKKLEEDIKLGILKNVSEAINSIVRRTYAPISRECLRWLIKQENIIELSILEELKSFRKKNSINVKTTSEFVHEMKH